MLAEKERERERGEREVRGRERGERGRERKKREKMNYASHLVLKNHGIVELST